MIEFDALNQKHLPDAIIKAKAGIDSGDFRLFLRLKTNPQWRNTPWIKELSAHAESKNANKSPATTIQDAGIDTTFGYLNPLLQYRKFDPLMPDSFETGEMVRHPYDDHTYGVVKRYNGIVTINWRNPTEYPSFDDISTPPEGAKEEKITINVLHALFGTHADRFPTTVEQQNRRNQQLASPTQEALTTQDDDRDRFLKVPPVNTSTTVPEKNLGEPTPQSALPTVTSNSSQPNITMEQPPSKEALQIVDENPPTQKKPNTHLPDNNQSGDDEPTTSFLQRIFDPAIRENREKTENIRTTKDNPDHERTVIRENAPNPPIVPKITPAPQPTIQPSTPQRTEPIPIPEPKPRTIKPPKMTAAERYQQRQQQLRDDYLADLHSGSRLFRTTTITHLSKHEDTD